jgi:superfamily II DNA helicase RecQ
VKKEFPFSFRLDEKTFDRIQEVKKEYEWNNDSEAGRNILEAGLEYLIRAKEFQKNPQSEVEINEKMLKLLQSLTVENKIESILKNFDQDIIQTIFRRSYLENKERENENRIKAEQLEEAKREAIKQQKEVEEQAKKEAEALKIWGKLWRMLPSGKGIEINCRSNLERKTVDIDDNVVDWSQINDQNDIPEGIEFIRYLDVNEISLISSKL